MTQNTQKHFVETVEEYIIEHRLILPGERVLVACSGGLDSTALLDILRALAERLKIALGVIHLDHGQHASSNKALGHVRSRCQRWKLPFFGQIASGQVLPPGSSEARLRKERYRCFLETATQNAYQRVALGHTQTDQVETILMRILRGTSVGGLAGIPVKRAEMYIRPLLECTRSDLVDYLKSRRLRCIQDPTNKSEHFLRNRIRHDILPTIRREVNPSVDKAILRLSRAAIRDSDLLDQMAATLHPDLSGKRQASILLQRLTNLHDSVMARVVLRMLLSIGSPGVNLEQAHLERLIEALRQEPENPDWAMDLPGGIVAGVGNESFFIRHGQPETFKAYKTTVCGPGQVILKDGTRLIFSVVNGFDFERLSANQVFFDMNCVNFPLVVRSFMPGDRLKSFGDSKTRKLSRILMDAKIPRHLRNQVPLVEKDGIILWVAGLRRSDSAIVPPSCKNILAIELVPGDLSLH
ncbi:MAG: tRNA lysidine(34) synthetase TilS [Deltaproteobacteria bacterium]|nr:tRNA lysidine(34) synthetase TilS [Deltaproteobacteria bacterium]MBW1870589.1 tRNA lysidine(34) synthetase TilS [Deltaproteobacteria bacterium]